MATIGGFELKGRAGVGGMGELFFASRLEQLPGFPKGQPVVLKWVPNSGPNPQWLSALHHELDVLCQFHELNLAQLSTANGVGVAHVQPVGLDQEGKWTYMAEGVVEGEDWEEPEPVLRTYIVLDDIRGQSLKKYLEDKRGHRVSDHEATIIAFRLARLLHLLHDEGRILHNDLKPDNVIIGPGAVPFRITLIDYGISVPLNDRLEAAGESHALAYWGVQEYMAPEKRRGGQGAGLSPLPSTSTSHSEPFDAAQDKLREESRRGEESGLSERAVLGWRTELWSLGAVTLALLGKADLLRRDTATIFESMDGIAPPLQAFLRKALQPEPAQRYSDWELVEQDLRACLGAFEDEPEPRGRRAGLRMRLSRRLGVALGLVLAAILAVAALAVPLLGSWG